MSINFLAIPADIRTFGQYIEFDSSRAVQGLAAMPHRILVIGQHLTTGTIAEAVPKQILSGSQAEEYFGRGSMLAEMCKALKGVNNLTECWAIALEDAVAGVAAAGAFTPTGPATSSGTLSLLIGGYRVLVPVAAGDIHDQIVDAIVAAVTARSDGPVTAAATGTVGSKVATITARHKGETGNAIDLRVAYYEGEKLPAGVGLTITPMTGGTTNPSLTTALAALGANQYHTIVCPYTDAANLTALETELANRWGPMVQLEGHAFAAARGTHAELTTLGNSRNSRHLTILGIGKSPTAPWLAAAVVGGVDAGEPDPARPRQTLELPGVLPPADADRFMRSERDLLLRDGIATVYVQAGGVLAIERLITTYQTSPLGVADTAYLDVETLRTLAYLRYTVRARIALRFPRHKLADDGTLYGPGQAIVTPSTIRSEMLVLFREWEEAGLVEGFEQFKRELVVQRNASDPNRVDVLLSPDLINQFRVFAGQVQFLL